MIATRHLLLTLAVLSLPATARAQTAPLAPSGFHEHDGFFARLRLGGGYFDAATSGNGNVAGRFTHDTGAVAVSLELGFAVVRDLILFAAINQVETVGGNPPIDQVDPATYSDLSFALPGFGASYYLPSNVYLSGTLGAAFLESDSLFAKTLSTNAGLGMSLSAGKEWWLFGNLGIGLALEYRHARARIPREDGTAGGPFCAANGLFLMTSATYN